MQNKHLYFYTSIHICTYSEFRSCGMIQDSNPAAGALTFFMHNTQCAFSVLLYAPVRHKAE